MLFNCISYKIFLETKYLYNQGFFDIYNHLKPVFRILNNLLEFHTHAHKFKLYFCNEKQLLMLESLIILIEITTIFGTAKSINMYLIAKISEYTNLQGGDNVPFVHVNIEMFTCEQGIASLI